MSCEAGVSSASLTFFVRPETHSNRPQASVTERKRPSVWIVTSCLALASTIGLGIWFYTYRVSAENRIHALASLAGQEQAKAFFNEGHYRLYEISSREERLEFTGRMDGPYEIWGWAPEEESDRVFMDAFNLQMKSLVLARRLETNGPNQSVETNALHGWQRR